MSLGSSCLEVSRLELSKGYVCEKFGIAGDGVMRGYVRGDDSSVSVPAVAWVLFTERAREGLVWKHAQEAAVQVRSLGGRPGPQCTGLVWEILGGVCCSCSPRSGSDLR